MLPGMFANMAPVIFKRVRFLDRPVDLGRKYKGKPLFGSHKTYRGFFFGILSSMVVVLLQTYLYGYTFFRDSSLIDYGAHNFALLGFLIGFGTLFGDLVKSFVKRRLDIKPGQRWFPFDQLDSVVGALLFVSIVYLPPIEVILFFIIFVPLFHIAVNHIAFYMGWKETKW